MCWDGTFPLHKDRPVPLPSFLGGSPPVLWSRATTAGTGPWRLAYRPCLPLRSCPVPYSRMAFSPAARPHPWGAWRSCAQVVTRPARAHSWMTAAHKPDSARGSAPRVAAPGRCTRSGSWRTWAACCRAGLRPARWGQGSPAAVPPWDFRSRPWAEAGPVCVHGFVGGAFCWWAGRSIAARLGDSRRQCADIFGLATGRGFHSARQPGHCDPPPKIQGWVWWTLWTQLGQPQWDWGPEVGTSTPPCGPTTGCLFPPTPLRDGLDRTGRRAIHRC